MISVVLTVFMIIISPLLQGKEQTEFGTSRISLGVEESNMTSLSCIFSLLNHLPTTYKEKIVDFLKHEWK